MAKKKSVKISQSKKDYKKELEGTIGSALPDLKAKLGEKKFNKRIKKAAKVLTEGLHLNGEHKKTDKRKLNGEASSLKENAIQNNTEPVSQSQSL